MEKRVEEEAAHPEEPVANGDGRKETMYGCDDNDQDLAVSGGWGATAHVTTLDDREERLGEGRLCRILMLFPQSLDEIRSVEKQERFGHIDGDCALLTRSAMHRDEDSRARTDADLSCGARGCPVSPRPSQYTSTGEQEGLIDTGGGTVCSSRNRICGSAWPSGTAHSLVCRSQTAEYWGVRIFIARSSTLHTVSARYERGTHCPQRTVSSHFKVKYPLPSTARELISLGNLVST